MMMGFRSLLFLYAEALAVAEYTSVSMSQDLCGDLSRLSLSDSSKKRPAEDEEDVEKQPPAKRSRSTKRRRRRNKRGSCKCVKHLLHARSGENRRVVKDTGKTLLITVH